MSVPEPQIETRTAPKILIWDIESTSLKASLGTILCIGYKWYDGKRVYVPSILDYTKGGMLDDKGLVEHFASVFAECDYHVTWYGLRFDHPFIETKLMKYGLGPLPPKPHIDLWRTARYKLRLHSNRLASVSEYLEIKDRKTEMNFGTWMRAAHGDKSALKEIRHHCKMDVLVLEQVFEKMRPWVNEQPVEGIYNPSMNCISCGSGHITRQGTKITRTRRYQQWKCQNCGKWMRSRLGEKIAPPILV